MRPRLVYLVTHSVTANLLLRGQLSFMRNAGFDVTLVGSPGRDFEAVAAREGVETIALPMAREPSPREDAVALARLARMMRTLRPTIVNAGTPKAGLLGMMAARAVGVPIRIYLLRGLRLETTKGTLRAILGTTERVASACATDVCCVSPSLLEAAAAHGHIPRKKARVVGAGSSNGVDTERYAPSSAAREAGAKLVRALGIADDEPLVAFVGRLNRDKGIVELLDAFAMVRRSVPKAKLLLIGGDLGDEAVDDALVARVRSAEGVVTSARVDDLVPWYARMDVHAFPSLREGFPNAVAEAASVEVPSVAFRSTGVVDGVVDGVTGALLARGDVAGMAAALVRYLQDPALRAAHGANARARVLAKFDRTRVWTAWADFYRERCAACGITA